MLASSQAILGPHPEAEDRADVPAYRVVELLPDLLDVLVDHPQVEPELPRLRQDCIQQLQVAYVLELVYR